LLRGKGGGLIGLSLGVPPLDVVMLGVELWLTGLSRSPPVPMNDDDEGMKVFLGSEGGISA